MNIVIIVLIIFAALASFIIIPRLIMAFKARSLQGKDAPTSHKASSQRIRSGKKTVLYFYSPSCRACKKQEPISAQIKKQHSNAIFKIDTSRNQEAARAYGVMGVPFIAFIEDAKIVKASAGLQSASTINGFLDKPS